LRRIMFGASWELMNGSGRYSDRRTDSYRPWVSSRGTCVSHVRVQGTLIRGSPTCDINIENGIFSWICFTFKRQNILEM
jgi:hypothetical protein